MQNPPTAAVYSEAHPLLRSKLRALSESWRQQGLPSIQRLETELAELRDWKHAHGIPGLWNKAPLMLTATLDDGLGQGLLSIHPLAEAAGLRVARLGVLAPPEEIIAACRTQQPALLGLTVLQLDSEDDLAHITSHMPPATAVIAGGAAFSVDPHLAGRCGVHWVARDMAHFLDLLLDRIFDAI